MKQRTTHMNFRLTLAAICVLIPALPAWSFETPKPAHAWELDTTTSAGFTLRGSAEQADGVAGKSLRLDGESLLLLANSTALAEQPDGFTLTAWVNPYTVGEEQQMVVAKNRYSLSERQWGVMIDRDGLFRLYLWQDKWVTIEAKTPPEPGHWYQLGVVVGPSNAELWVNGQQAGNVSLTKPIPQTAAPLTLGGVDDNGQIRQTLFGAVDDVRLFDRPLTAREIAAIYAPTSATHQIPQPPQPFVLWDETATLGKASELPELADVEFQVIKKWDKAGDGYTFLHGVGLAWHDGKLYASIGHNKGAENTVSEEAQYRVSDDGGKTWGPLRVIDEGEAENLAVSHGVFLSHNGTLWAFHGAYHNRMERIHTRAYRFDAEQNAWRKLGVVIENGFWPMNQPVKMADGNWIMPGISAGPYAGDKVFPAAVAISHGDDFTQWDFVKIPADEHVRHMWGESAVFLDGANVYNIARYGSKALALAAVSEDCGRSWSMSRSSNLPMATSKPAAGNLSTGQRYLVCTTARENGGKRTPLTIAVSRLGENVFSKVFVIRRSQNPQHPGESADFLSLSYPCAFEHDGKLYIGYSNNGGRRGNLNSAELAIVPISSLKVTPAPSR